MSDPLFLTAPELAAALQVPVSWVYAQTCRPGLDSIPRVRLGKGYRFDLADVVRWLKECRDPRLSLSPSRRSRVLPSARRRAPNYLSGGQQAKNAGRTRVPANGPAAGALGVP